MVSGSGGMSWGRQVRYAGFVLQRHCVRIALAVIRGREHAPLRKGRLGLLNERRAMGTKQSITATIGS